MPVPRGSRWLDHPVRLPEAKRHAVVDMYRTEGVGITTVAKALGVGETTVIRILEEAGIPRDRSKLRTGPGRRRFDDDVSKEIAAKYASGAALQALAKEYGSTQGPIARAVRLFGEGLRPRGNKVREFSSDQMAKMKRLWLAGASQTALGQIFNAHQTVISNALRLHGIEPEARRQARGSGHGSWKGGRSIHRASGYVSVLEPPDSPFAAMCNTAGRVLEHRLLMAQSLGRPLRPTETVHHINGDRTDNRIANLELRQGKHGKHIVFCCADCGSRNVVPVTLA